jgi:hypothetical protein
MQISGGEQLPEKAAAEVLGIGRGGGGGIASESSRGDSDGVSALTTELRRKATKMKREPIRVA